RGRLLGGAAGDELTRAGGDIEAMAASEGIAAVIRLDPGDGVLGMARQGRPHPGRQPVRLCRGALTQRPLRVEDVLDDGDHGGRLERSRSSEDLQARAIDRHAHYSNSTNSTRVPAMSAGWTNAIRAPRPPIRGVSSTSFAPTDRRCSSAASMSATA